MSATIQIIDWIKTLQVKEDYLSDKLMGIKNVDWVLAYNELTALKIFLTCIMAYKNYFKMQCQYDYSYFSLYESLNKR